MHEDLLCNPPPFVKDSWVSFCPCTTHVLSYFFPNFEAVRSRHLLVLVLGDIFGDLNAVKLSLTLRTDFAPPTPK